MPWHCFEDSFLDLNSNSGRSSNKIAIKIVFKEERSVQSGKMQAAKDKLSNMSNVAKEHIKIHKARAEEKMEKATARTKGEKELAHERRKAKEAEAKLELHNAKAEHIARREDAHHSHLFTHEPTAPTGVSSTVSPAMTQTTTPYLVPATNATAGVGTSVPMFPATAETTGPHSVPITNPVTTTGPSVYKQL